MILVGRHAAWYSRLSAFALRWLYRGVARRMLVDLSHSATVLDVGTGPGHLLVELARRRADLHIEGVDPSADMVDHAARGIATARLAGRAHAQLGTAERLPFPDQNFDGVVSTLSSHHWADPAAAIAEQLRVLRPGGQLWVVDLRGLTPATVREELRDRSPAVVTTRPRIGWLASACVVCHRAVPGQSAVMDAPPSPS